MNAFMVERLSHEISHAASQLQVAKAHGIHPVVASDLEARIKTDLAKLVDAVTDPALVAAE